MSDNQNTSFYNSQSCNPYLANYMQHNPQFSSMYPYDQSNSLLQSASALAAVAAAVGYGQQQHYSSAFSDTFSHKSSPLNLAHGSSSNNYSQSRDNETQDASALRTAGQYQSYYDAWQQYYPFGNPINPSNSPTVSNVQSSKPSIPSATLSPGSFKKVKSAHVSSKTKIKSEKKTKSEDMGNNQKKKEFDILVKARTDKLMSDGPAPYVSQSQDTNPQSRQIEALTKNPAAQPNAYAKLIQLVLDAKKRSLMKSPAIQKYFDKQQRHLEAYKRSTELFRVTLNLQPRNSTDNARN